MPAHVRLIFSSCLWVLLVFGCGSSDLTCSSSGTDLPEEYTVLASGESWLGGRYDPKMIRIFYLEEDYRQFYWEMSGNDGSTAPSVDFSTHRVVLNYVGSGLLPRQVTPVEVISNEGNESTTLVFEIGVYGKSCLEDGAANDGQVSPGAYVMMAVPITGWHLAIQERVKITKQCD